MSPNWEPSSALDAATNELVDELRPVKSDATDEKIDDGLSRQAIGDFLVVVRSVASGGSRRSLLLP